jgi:hypothetical protein
MNQPDAVTVPTPDATAEPVNAGSTTGADSTTATGSPATPPPRRSLELTVRVAGVLVSVLAALLTGVLEVLFASWRVGGNLIGVSAIVAVPANLAIAWFAYRTVGRRWAVGPPWVVWTVLMFIAAGVRTTEGDYLLSGDNWVGLIMILLGSMAFAIYAYRMILAGIPKR